ncbi:MAG: transcription elongation factor GreA [Parcubacteria group bacterium GW2011_GWA1_50_14]|uniref:Transcription elongation factor GreA n=2 Tax=Candidatus Colwelliibacteriota TaxID=1817904 RepID=A0A1G1ZD36_9BACT|nr:MAG: transcription elongation factor GreA [Parcubacteria group bacterium GW2011_GWA1_50_14]OGY57427.1 MAG: hypothetical protein A3C03_02605 [Candidatus Colwellbacteria bacterium RIFCSPHIGHO2_02_FULL_45_17]OGY61045.1 MAG: hypothetical protein A3I33_00215 [Candidatus Colwellbacteria bacterium RIFCSPLOWO2_02_FULL_45_11]OGY62532.1 MAG: hypothetical protein A3G58_01680 [Candidatus Colwellbacteria bacterium RIFCSPLOWO2_12_FULL_46_17]
MEEFLTAKRFEELKNELEELKTAKRLEVAENLRDAKELGDLTENSEYLEAREEQGRVEKRITELEETIKNASIIKEGSSKGVVGVGSTVEVLRGGKSMKFVIVGTNEAKPENGFISYQSPLGKELIGKKAGDSVKINAPSGSAEYVVRQVN